MYKRQGFIFVCLDEYPSQTLEQALGEEAKEVESWPLEDMVIVHEEVSVLDCNWKIFWENFNECYHCPRIHPELCKVVPLYAEGIQGHYDQPGWEPKDDRDNGEPSVAEGMTTWTVDGISALPELEGLDGKKKAKGMTFATLLGSMYVVGHPQYARSVRLRPLGPETLELTATWFLPPETAAAHPEEVEHLLSLVRLVIAQDGLACEWNQAGLHSHRHTEGVLVPQESGVAWIHDWLRGKLGES